MKLHRKIKGTHKSYAHLHQILISTLYLTLSSTTLALNLINNPLNNHPDYLRVGAQDGYIVAFGRYPQDQIRDVTVTSKTRGIGDIGDTYQTRPIAWRILDSENLDQQSNLRCTTSEIASAIANDVTSQINAAIKSTAPQSLADQKQYGDAKGLTLLAQKVLDNTGSFSF